MDKRKILMIGSSVMELSLNMFQLPEPGQTVTDDGGVAYLPSGGATGLAVALSKLGADAMLCTKLGADAHGQSMYENYRELGIDTCAVKVDHEFPTGLCVTIKEGDGAERRVIYPGANENLTVENIQEAFGLNPEMLVLDLTLPAAVTSAAAKIASAKGIPFAVCPTDGIGDSPVGTLPQSEFFVIDDVTAEKMCGTRPAGTDSCLRAALAVYRQIHTKYLVIRLDRRGTFFYDGKHYGMVPPVGNGKLCGAARDLTDVYNASLLLGYLTGGDVKGSAMLAESAMAVFAAKGATHAVYPTTPEVYEFLSRNR
ncbi:MAG: PfkB family carbohydrate kinase [Clostridia bacterium]|nr:PfkB family carbohydrate kinase [Clostridia bacterium]